MPAGAGITVAIDALEKTMQEMINNSKIINTIDKEISKALGLLMDLILLPFLPLLAFGIVMLYGAILGFSNWWQKVWDKLEKEGLGGLIKLALEWVWDKVVEWAKSFLEWAFGDAPLSKKILDVISGISDAFLDSMIPLLPITWRQLFKILLGGNFDKAMKIAVPVWAKWAEDTIQFVLDVLSFMFGHGVTTKNKDVDFVLNLLRMANPIKWLEGIIQYMLGDPTNLKKDFDFVISLKTGVVDPIIKALLDAGGSAIEVVKHFFGYADGGVVPGPKGQAQFAVVHGGETIVPSGQTMGGGVTNFNFYGLTNDQLPEKVRSILRQEGTRYSA